ncbi:hypothetical protein [Dinoroseobacter sp. S76]|uniref:hypothetical protein n=1 Tax=Dinoroseobacter sp. S76 TaxID=3415124 RepID=UPI003C79BFD6
MVDRKTIKGGLIGAITGFFAASHPAAAEWTVDLDRMQSVCLALLDGVGQQGLDVRALSADEKLFFYGDLFSWSEPDDPVVTEYWRAVRLDAVLTLPVTIHEGRCSYAFPVSASFDRTVNQIVEWPSLDEHGFVLTVSRMSKNPSAFSARYCAAIGPLTITGRHFHVSQYGQVLQGAFSWTNRTYCNGLSIETLKEAL